MYETNWTDMPATGRTTASSHDVTQSNITGQNYNTWHTDQYGGHHPQDTTRNPNSHIAYTLIIPAAEACCRCGEIIPTDDIEPSFVCWKRNGPMHLWMCGYMDNPCFRAWRNDDANPSNWWDLLECVD